MLSPRKENLKKLLLEINIIIGNICLISYHFFIQEDHNIYFSNLFVKNAVYSKKLKGAETS